MIYMVSLFLYTLRAENMVLTFVPLVFRLDDRGCQLYYSQWHRHRGRIAGLAQKVPSWMVPKVQFRSRWYVIVSQFEPRFSKLTRPLCLLLGAMDGGAQIMVFILSFAVYGASGTSRPFPTWWGNPDQNVDYVDHCAVPN